jgi:ribosomal protein S18 acetylase RimI-like enzyme
VAEAQRLGCCKLTLEVLERNPARRLYESCGFEHVEYDNDAGMSLFYAKTL